MIQNGQYFLFIFFNFYCYFILLYNTVLVLPYLDMNPPRVYMRSQHESPSHVPPHNIPLGHPHAPAPSMLYPASDIYWRFNSYMRVYVLECHSPKSSHPLPLPLSPKVRYTHLCLFSCLAYRVVIAIFLNRLPPFWALCGLAQLTSFFPVCFLPHKMGCCKDSVK